MPKLKSVYDAKADIPTEYFGLFTEKDGKFYLDQVEDMEPKARVDEFRNNNIELSRQLDDLKAKFKDIDPTLARELIAKKSDLDDQKIVKKEGVDALVEQKTRALKDAHQTKVTELEGTIGKLNKQLERVTVEQAAVAECLKLGALKPGAAEFIVNAALGTFRVENGETVAYDKDGQTKRYNKEAKPFNMQDFAKEALEKYDYLWVGNKGGGGSGGGGGKGGGGAYDGPNPFDDKTANYAEQARLIREQPDEARRLHRAAGKGELQIMDVAHRGDSRDANG